MKIDEETIKNRNGLLSGNVCFIMVADKQDIAFEMLRFKDSGSTSGQKEENMRTGQNRICRWMTSVFFVIMLLSVCIKPTAVYAASGHMQWYDGSSEAAISVEAGSSFYIGDFVILYKGSSSSTVSLLKGSYRSSSAKTASVNGKGYLKAKKAGTADITVRCQGMTTVCHLTVEKKGTFDLKKDTAVQNLNKAAGTLAKGLPKKLNANSAYNLAKKTASYESAYESLSMKKLSYEGFLFEQERPAPNTGAEYGRSEKLAVPQAGRYLTAQSLLGQFKKSNDPTAAGKKKSLKIASAAAKAGKNSITVKLKKGPDVAQILAAQLVEPVFNSSVLSKSSAILEVSIFDTTDEAYYRGHATLKRGSKTLTLNVLDKSSKAGKAIELQKGHTYLIGSSLNWANAYRVKAK